MSAKLGIIAGGVNLSGRVEKPRSGDSCVNAHGQEDWFDRFIDNDENVRGDGAIELLDGDGKPLFFWRGSLIYVHDSSKQRKQNSKRVGEALHSVDHGKSGY